MIVVKLIARDILKYRRLDLQDLPERGLILVTGPNESGKSSVGETLCLALFGRTFALTGEAIEKAVRWDSMAGSVEIEFTTRDGRRLRVERRLDRDGLRAASLVEDGHELRGWDAVTAAVQEALGFGFPEYVESFYLARREIAPPHPRSDTLKAMAGVLRLEHIAEDLRKRIFASQERLAELRAEVAQTDEQLVEFQRDDLLPPRPGSSPSELAEEAEQRIEQLKDTKRQLGDRIPRLEEAIGELIAACDGAALMRWAHAAERAEVGLDSLEESASFLGYRDLPTGTDRLSRALERIQEGLEDFRTLKNAIIPRRGELGVRLGVEGYTGPGRTFADEEDDLQDELGASRKTRDAAVRLGGFLAVGAAVLAVLGFLPIQGLPAGTDFAFWGVAAALAAGSAVFGARARSAGRTLAGLRVDEDDIALRREAAQRELDALTGFEGLALADAVGKLAPVSTPDVAQAVQAFRNGAGGKLVDGAATTRLGEGLAKELEGLRAAAVALQARIVADIETLEHIHTLRELRARLETSKVTIRDRMATSELAIELIAGAAKQMTFDFNRSVRQGMARVLPSLTEGRYQYLRIDDELKVRVFSSEKQDFVSFEEISGGTQRQIALATRLALSEALVRSAVHDTQFLFLDEPFAFFDAQRTRNSMNALPRVSDDLTQIWIAAQEAPSGAGADVHLECTTGNDRLVFQG